MALAVQLLKIHNPQSLEFTQKKTPTLNDHKSRSGADIDLVFNHQFSIFFAPSKF